MGLILKDDNSNGGPEDLAAMIDKIFKQGSGHLVIDLDAAEEGGMRFTTANTTDCGPLGACAQPTEFIDEDDEMDLPLEDEDIFDDEDDD